MGQLGQSKSKTSETNEALFQVRVWKSSTKQIARPFGVRLSTKRSRFNSNGGQSVILIIWGGTHIDCR